MKPLRRISAGTILSLMLAISVMAGQVETPGAPAPARATSTIVGQIDTTGAPAPTSSTTQTDVTAASILLTVLSLIYS